MFDEGVARFVHDGTLEIFFRAEVCEEAALADAEGRGEFADGQSFEAFAGSEIDGFAEDGVAGFQAARAASGRGAYGVGFVVGFCFHARMIARPFVLFQAPENEKLMQVRGPAGSLVGSVSRAFAEGNAAEV